MRGDEPGGKRAAWRLAAMILAASGAQAGLAAAAPPLLFGGASFAEHGERYEYLGVATSFLPPQYLTQRLMLSDYQYGYPSNGTDVVVRGQAVEAALGIKSASDAGWIEASAGLRYRNNEVSPPGVDVHAESHPFGLVLGVQGEWQFAQRWAFNGIGTYTIGPASFWARGRLLRRIAGSVSLGIEAIGHGDPDYRAVQGGVVLTGIKVTDTLMLGFYSGLKKTSGQARSVYGGLELSKAF
jgi:hypothetical protein